MELFDICDENGIPTGETIERTKAHELGVCHRTAHIWVIREKDGAFQALLQKRSMNKDSFPGKYDTSSAGHIQAGDEPTQSAVRELSEELGIYAKEEELIPIGKAHISYEKEFYGKLFRDKEVAFIYAYDGLVEEDKLVLQKEELDSVKWFDVKEIVKACEEPRNPAFCVPMQGLKILYKYLYHEDL